jgi:hypothetical protein
MIPLVYPIDKNLRSYKLDRTVGVMQTAYEKYWEHWNGNTTVPHPHALWTTKELTDDVRMNGITAIKIWMKGDPFDGGEKWCWSPDYWDVEQNGHFSCAFGDYGFEEMADVWVNSGITTFTLRFTSIAWSSSMHGSCTPSSPKLCEATGQAITEEPTYDIARTFLERFGDLPITVIFTDWEQDWPLRGLGSRGYDEEGRMRFPWTDHNPWYSNECFEQYSYQECGEMLLEERWNYMKSVIERRQLAVMRARAEHPNANMRVMHAAVFNRYANFFKPEDLGSSILDVIMEIPVRHRPDLLFISFWDRRGTITEALDWAEAKTHYPRHRFGIDELGEWREAEQYDRIYNTVREAWCWGVDLVNIWMWKQTWHDLTKRGVEKNYGLFYRDDPEPNVRFEFGAPRPGWYAVQDLLNEPSDYCEPKINRDQPRRRDYEGPKRKEKEDCRRPRQAGMERCRNHIIDR